MASIVRLVARPSVKQSEIVDNLRQRIIAGEFGPGAQIPQRTRLEEQFQASSVTVQKALDRLAQDGFVCAKGRRGTFVSETPPHLSQYALVFPSRPEQGRPWGNFWTVLRDMAAEFKKNGRPCIKPFYTSNKPGVKSDYAELAAAVQDRRVAGLIFSGSPHDYFNTPLLDEPSIPRVAVMSKAVVPGVAAIAHDSASFISKALDYLKARGRKRVCLIVTDSVHPNADFISNFAAAMRERGMEFKRQWVQSLDIINPDWAVNMLELMMAGTPSQRPDGMVIFDDHLIEKTIVGLIACGIRVPNEMEVIAQTNFPLLVPSPVPIKRLGYDARQCVNLCVEYIDRCRSGKSPATYTSVPAVFEDELPGNG
jgi:DNA-binding GntR family transcriptional regulator